MLYDISQIHYTLPYEMFKNNEIFKIQSQDKCYLHSNGYGYIFLILQQ